MNDSETPIVFLAMFWGGGGPYSISQLLNVYDWINRDIISRKDLEKALNTLLSLNLIVQQDDKFRIPRDVGMAFDVFRKKRRKSKFKTVRKYFEKFDIPKKVPKTIRISEKRYQSELERYKASF
ncbi:MAG: hypothetical protein ACYTHM_01990 [Planctomycetota bacterium]|jgi:hypothetical protein